MPSALVMTNEPSAAISAMGKPTAWRSGTSLRPGVGEVAAGHLGAALEQVAGDRRAGEGVPVRLAPAEMGHRRPDHERRVGDAPGDDDLGTGPQGVRDRRCAEVDVGADQLAAGVGRGEVASQEFPAAVVRQVVALHDRDRRTGTPCSRAICRIRRAAARGLAAPKLLTMGMPLSRHCRRTGLTMRSMSGRVAGPGSRRRSSWARASVRSASTSKTSTARAAAAGHERPRPAGPRRFGRRRTRRRSRRQALR